MDESLVLVLGTMMRTSTPRRAAHCRASSRSGGGAKKPVVRWMDLRDTAMAVSRVL